MIKTNELGPRGFYEINKSPLVYANYTKGIILVQNGEGFIPYINAKLTSQISECVPCIQIDDVSDLDMFLGHFH